VAADLTLDLDAQIALWRSYLTRHQAVHAADVDELEDHLRAQIADLTAAGLSEDEAFLVAVKRLGGVDALSHEFAREHSDRLWKQLVLTPESGQPSGKPSRDLLAALAFAVGAGLAIKLPELLGFGVQGDATGGPTVFGLAVEGDPSFYGRNLSLFALPFLAGFFAWRRRLRPAVLAWVVGLFATGALAANLYPFTPDGATVTLLAITLPVALWFVVGLAYVGGEWRSHDRRMDFIRFTGEWLIYYTLIAIGGGVLVALTQGAFSSIGVDAIGFLSSWVIPCGAMGAVVIAGFLVEAKQSVVENMAPVLTKVFTPLAALMLLTLLVAMAWAGTGVDTGRELLIISDLLLVLVLGLLLYSWSAREATAPPGWFDRLQLVLVGAAVLVDLLGLVAMVTRISTWGPSPNKFAALGLNLILLVNLAWSARLMVGFLRERRPFAALARWQTGYLPVLAGWAAVIVLVFPPVFGFG